MDKGAQFYRCDFQVHTPRDTNWVGDIPDTDSDRAAYATELIVACRIAGLDAIAITDHHDLSFFPYVRAAARSETDDQGQVLPIERQMTIFPGMELTLAVPCQALLIFDADLPDDRLSVITEALAIPPTAIDKPLGPVVRLEFHTFSDLYEELNKREWLRGRFIVLPNVSESGTSTLLRSGMASKYREMPCVGGYVDGLITQHGTGNWAILTGQDENYGFKKLAVVQTSDNRRRDHRDLGRSATWIKWATPTAEALRQACLADETRLSHTLPPIPTTYVSRLSVSNSSFLGPVELELNRQYNAIIGGRGTGKSTILEYLRWALCDQPPAPLPDEDATDPASRRERLIRTTLGSMPDAIVEVHFVVNELSHIVRREATTGNVSLKVGNQPYRSVSEADVRSVIPIQAYSQKQLSSVSVRVDELTRFVTAPILSRLTELKAELAAVAAEIRETYARLQRHRQLQATLRRDELAVASLSEQAVKLREGLTDVSTADRELLERRPRYEEARQYAEGVERTATRASSVAHELTASLQRLLAALPQPGGDLPERERLLDMRAAVEAALVDAVAAADAMASGISALSEESSGYRIARDAWQAAAAEHDRQYEEASQRWTAHEQRVAELAQVEARQRGLNDVLAGLRDEITDLGSPDDEYRGLRETWQTLRTGHVSAIRDQCDELTELSENVIRATVEPGTAMPELAEAVKSAISGSGTRAGRIDVLAETLAQRPDPLGEWESALDELEQLASYDPSDALAGAIPDTPTLLALSLPKADVQRIAARLTPEAWLELSLTPIADKPRFSYRTRESQYIPFENASAGQQATALLHVLLNQSGPPLIVDQPEDDLDNEVVLDVAEQIWHAKRQRQLIFTSHNANLVVNGDADLVVCCEYRVAGDHSGGRVGHEGAIDVPDVRDAITRVMEGGEKAFRLRTAKYGF